MARTSAEVRRKLGQIFTPATVSQFMAGLFAGLPEEATLLDAGAGVGALTAAVCQRYLSRKQPSLLRVHAVESDIALTELLDDVLQACRRALRRAGHAMEYRIHTEDFILQHADLFAGTKPLFPAAGLDVPFDGVITNPPYFKLNKDSPHARAMEAVIHGQPNIYAFFLAVAARLLREGGELVAITPRSFCNGLYFRGFRRWFFDRMSLADIHTFQSRTATFREANVLQESVITRFVRSTPPQPVVKITRSKGRDFSGTLDVQSVPYPRIVDRSHCDVVIRIPEARQDADVCALVETWPARFAELGLKISTGPVVMFRATQYLLDDAKQENAVPLLSAHNVKPFSTLWPVEKKKWPVAFLDSRESRKLLVPKANYVLVKRFSAKEERRRLTAGCFLADDWRYRRIALENHLNYIYHADRPLSAEEVFGIAALFNSALLDRYFRAISGNTQVNATEIRQLPFPAADVLSTIGRKILALPDRSAAKLEQVVLLELGAGGRLSKYLEGFTA